MATEENAAKGAPPAPQAQLPTTALSVAVAPPAASDESKLTPAQLKAKAKAEKAARREKTKEVKAIVAAASTGPMTGQDAKASKGKGKQEGLQPGKTTHTHRSSVSGRRPSFAILEKDARSFIPECFSHLPMAKRAQLSHAHKDVHPAVLAAGQQMATFAIKDSISRLEATLLAFKKVNHLVQYAVFLSLTRDRSSSHTTHPRTTRYHVTLSLTS